MSCDSLVKYFKDISKTVVQLSRDEPRLEHPGLEFPNDIKSRVEVLLQSLPELDGIEKKTLRRISGGGSISVARIATSVLERLSLGDQPESICADLVDFVCQKDVPNYYLAGISGIALADKLTLSDQVSLVTADNIAPNWAREFVFRINRLGRIEGAGHEPLRPQAALMISNNQQVLFPSGSRSHEEGRLSMETVRKLERMIISCITLASDTAAPTITAKTSWIDHPAYSYHGLMGGSGGKSPGEKQTSRYDEFDKNLTRDLFARVSVLDEGVQLTVLLAAELLCSSRLHESPVNRAIDLGIALEVIFLHGVKNTTELGYRAATHAAFFLGSDAEERRTIHDAVRDAYGARSEAVHTGKLEKTRYIENHFQADRLCRQALVKLVIDGGFPEDWSSLIFAT